MLGWAMLTLMSEIRNAGRVLPDFTNLCIALRPALLICPFLAAAYYLFLLIRKEENVSRWSGFVIATMAVLLLFVVPAMSTSYLLMVDQVRASVASR
jgi:hypothetical protein